MYFWLQQINILQNDGKTKWFLYSNFHLLKVPTKKYSSKTSNRGYWTFSHMQLELYSIENQTTTTEPLFVKALKTFIWIFREIWFSVCARNIACFDMKTLKMLFFVISFQITHMLRKHRLLQVHFERMFFISHHYYWRNQKSKRFYLEANLRFEFVRKIHVFCTAEKKKWEKTMFDIWIQPILHQLQNEVLFHKSVDSSSLFFRRFTFSSFLREVTFSVKREWRKKK